MATVFCYLAAYINDFFSEIFCSLYFFSAFLVPFDFCLFCYRLSSNICWSLTLEEFILRRNKGLIGGCVCVHTCAHVCMLVVDWWAVHKCFDRDLVFSLGKTQMSATIILFPLVPWFLQRPNPKVFLETSIVRIGKEREEWYFTIQYVDFHWMSLLSKSCLIPSLHCAWCSLLQSWRSGSFSPDKSTVISWG